MTEVVGLAISTFKGVYKAFVFIEEYRGADAQVIEAKGQFQETDRLLHAVRSRRIDLWCEGTDNDVLTEVQVVERRTWHELAHFDNTILKRMDHSKSRFPAYRKVRNKISWVRHMEATSRELLILSVNPATPQQNSQFFFFSPSSAVYSLACLVLRAA